MEPDETVPETETPKVAGVAATAAQEAPETETPREVKITPTVGRMVYYKSYGTPNGEYKPQNRAATITEVVDAEKGIVSLFVMNPTGVFFNQNVKQGQEGGQWDWMPYQKGQAKKTEALEKKLEVSEDRAETPNA